MKKTTLWKSFFLLFALIVGSNSVWADDYKLLTSAPSDWTGDYVIVSSLSSSASTFITDGSVTGNNFSTATAVKTLSTAKITYNSTTKILSGVTNNNVFHIGAGSASGKYYITLKGANTTIYLIANSSTGSSSLSTATATTNADWTIGGFNSTSGNVYLVGKSGRYLGWNSSYFRAFAESNKDTYKAYIFKRMPSTPNPSVAAGDFNAAFDLTITGETGSKLKYTTDGSDPSTSNTATSVANNTTTINIPAETTRVRAIAIKEGMNSSELDATYTYVNASAPNATVSEASIDFGEVEVGKTKQMTFTITPANLTSALTIESNNNKYTVSPTSIAQDVTTSQTITVTAAPTALDDDMDGNITISGGGLASNKTVSLSATLYQNSHITLVASPAFGTFTYNTTTVTSIDSRVGNKIKVTAIPNEGYIFTSWNATNATPASSDTPQTEFTLNDAAVTLTANFAVDPCAYATLEESDIASMTGTNGYGNVKTVTKNGLTWNTTGYRQSATDKYIQLKSDTSPYIQLPQIPGYIQTITFTVTNANASSKTGTAPTVSFMFRTSSSGSNIITTGNDGNTLIIDLSKKEDKYSTGYIVSSAGARVWDISVGYIPTATIPASGYATLSCTSGLDFANAVDLSNGKTLKAYVIPENDGAKLTLAEKTEAAANTGVLLKGTVGQTYTIPVKPNATTVGSNLLKAGPTTVPANNETIYLLKSGQFHLATAGTTSAGKAYLELPSAIGARELTFSFGNEATGINNIEVNDNLDTNAPMYNLAGQRVNKSYKGVVIVNGKKMLNK